MGGVASHAAHVGVIEGRHAALGVVAAHPRDESVSQSWLGCQHEVLQEAKSIMAGAMDELT